MLNDILFFMGTGEIRDREEDLPSVEDAWAVLEDLLEMGQMTVVENDAVTGALLSLVDAARLDGCQKGIKLSLELYSESKRVSLTQNNMVKYGKTER